MFCFSMGITKYLIKVVTESFSVKKNVFLKYCDLNVYCNILICNAEQYVI